MSTRPYKQLKKFKSHYSKSKCDKCGKLKMTRNICYFKGQYLCYNCRPNLQKGIYYIDRNQRIINPTRHILVTLKEDDLIKFKNFCERNKISMSKFLRKKVLEQLSYVSS